LRKLLFALPILAFAPPALAQTAHVDDEIARGLPHPGEVEAMGDVLGRVADAVMDVDVGPIADAVEPGRRHRDRTLGDIASRDDPYARERISDSIDAATIGLGAAVAQLAILTPALRRTLDELDRAIDEAVRDGRHRRRD
jgi:hypothetical protein